MSLLGLPSWRTICPNPLADIASTTGRGSKNHADTTSRDSLVALRDHWRDVNAWLFDGRMLEPYITLTEPSAPAIYGQCCPVSSGDHPPSPHLSHTPLPPGFADGRMQFVKDVLTHEMIHQHIMEHQPGVNEDSYHGHGPVFTDHCNRLGAKLGLDEVVVRNRGGKKLPKAAQWPHCVAGPDRYGGAYQPHRKAVTASTVTASTVTIPIGYRAEAIAQKPIAGEEVLDIGFAPASGDGPLIQLLIQVDAAEELADFIAEYLTS